MSSNENSSEESDNYTTPGKKRTKNPEKWIANKRKFARQLGRSYISTSGGFVEEKKTGPPCT